MSNLPGLMVGQGNGGPSDLNLQHDIPEMQDFQHDSSRHLPLPLSSDETTDWNRQFSSSTAGYTIPDAEGVQRRNGASSHSSLDSFEQSNDGGAVQFSPSPPAALPSADELSTILQESVEPQYLTLPVIEPVGLVPHNHLASWTTASRNAPFVWDWLPAGVFASPGPNTAFQTEAFPTVLPSSPTSVADLDFAPDDLGLPDLVYDTDEDLAGPPDQQDAYHPAPFSGATLAVFLNVPLDIVAGQAMLPVGPAPEPPPALRFSPVPLASVYAARPLADLVPLLSEFYIDDFVWAGPAPEGHPP